MLAVLHSCSALMNSAKLGGIPCVHQDVGEKGCSIHAESARKYVGRIAAFGSSGGLELKRTAPIVWEPCSMLSPRVQSVRLEIRESRPGLFEASTRLAAIAEDYRSSMPVQITDVGDVLDPDRSYRLLLSRMGKSTA